VEMGLKSLCLFLEQNYWASCHSPHKLYVKRSSMTMQSHDLRWFISNCSGNENLLKLPRGEVYDIYAHTVVKAERKVGITEHVSKIWQVQYATFSPMWRHLDPFTSYRNNRNRSTVIELF
jgi:hypothetical protein